LSFEINVSNGFVAGGPWITYEYSMKRLTATELVLEGGKYVEARIEPPANRFSFFQDVAVLAFPAPEGAACLLPPSPCFFRPICPNWRWKGFLIRKQNR
jgi:hypothetical protein